MDIFSEAIGKVVSTDSEPRALVDLPMLLMQVIDFLYFTVSVEPLNP